MLAQVLEGNEHKLKFPLYVQAKLDGFRGLAVIDKNVDIFSRSGKPFSHLEKIKGELETFPLLKKGNFLDGEIYTHNVSIFELRRVLGRREIDSNEIRNIERNITYEIFDYFAEIPFSERWENIRQSYKKWRGDKTKIKLVETFKVENIKELDEKRNYFLEKGYEGIIVRNSSGIYKSGMSSNIFRSKEFKKSMFKIIDATEGKGENKGTVIWKLECKKDKNKSFYARPIGTREERREYFKNKDKFIGKMIEIKYMSLDDLTGCVSRFPVALRIK